MGHSRRARVGRAMVDDGEGGGRPIAPLIGAPAGSVGMCENVTTAHMSVLSTLALPAARDAIVCSAADFPSMVNLFRAQETLGYRLVVVLANDDGSADPARIADAIDDRTALVAVSHVLFRSSFILDPAPIVEKARRVGAPVDARPVPGRGDHPR